MLQATITSQQSVEQIAAALDGDLTPLDRFILLRLLDEVIEPALQAAAA